MKRMLLLFVCLVLISNTALANTISIYNDANGASCFLPLGFNPNVTIIEKFTTGSVECRFSMTIGTNQFISFSSPFTTIGNVTSDITVNYGQCIPGSIVIGTAVMNLTGGYLYIHPAQGQTQVLSTDCALVTHGLKGGYGAVGNINDVCNQQVSAETSTWGRVKELYR